MQEHSDAAVVREYGERQPTFGGVYFDGDVVVALFTDDVGQHFDALHPRLRAPQNFRTERAARSYVEVEASNHRVQRLLMLSARPHPGVVAVGIGNNDGELAVCVSVENLTDDRAREIRETVAPDVVLIRPGVRPRRL